MTERRFPPPWSVEERLACFISWTENGCMRPHAQLEISLKFTSVTYRPGIVSCVRGVYGEACLSLLCSGCAEHYALRRLRSITSNLRASSGCF